MNNALLKKGSLLFGLTLCAASQAATERASLNPAFSSRHVEWLKCAETDLKAAKKLSESDELAGPLLYHVQQCVEKALKAYLVYQKKPVIKTHNLVELINACGQIDGDFKSMHTAAKTLSPYATASRYPNSRFSADIALVDRCMRQALDILLIVKNKLAL